LHFPEKQQPQPFTSSSCRLPAPEFRAYPQPSSPDVLSGR
jgi:hypothetical protein